MQLGDTPVKPSGHIGQVDPTSGAGTSIQTAPSKHSLSRQPSRSISQKLPSHAEN